MPGRRILKVAGDLRFVRVLRWVLWALLVAAVILAVPGPQGWLESEVADGRLPRIMLLLPALVFAGFLVGFTLYRFTLVRAGRYNAGKAFLQVGLGILVATFLARPGWARWADAARPAAARVELGPLLRHPDPRVRAIACEALAGREPAPGELALARALADADPDPRVRQACKRVF